VEVAQPAAQFLAHLCVERTEGLVEQEDARLDREGAGERDALSLAAGELAGVALAEAGKLDEVVRPKPIFLATVMCRKRA
jgi:hypothetical protein